MEPTEAAEAAIMRALAGRIAERVAQRGDSPGWRRLLLPRARYAFHEGGHAVVAHATGASVRFLTINTQNFGGCCVYGGGGVSQLEELRLEADRGAPADHELVMQRAGLLPGDSLRNLLRLYRATRALLVLHWRAVVALACGLETAGGELSGAEATDIIQRHM